MGRALAAAGESEREILDTYEFYSTDVGLYLATICNAERIVIGERKAHQLVYLTSALYLVHTGARLVDEAAVAMPEGPVYVQMREALRGCALARVTEADIEEEVRAAMRGNKAFRDAAGWVAGAMGSVHNETGLRAWLCDDAGPWGDAYYYGGGGIEPWRVIDDGAVRRYFSKVFEAVPLGDEGDEGDEEE